jgi:hypothetical protein
MAKSLPAPTASTVRQALREPSKFSTLSPEAQATVREGARGRLHPDAIKAFNRGRKANRRYVLGVGISNKAQAQAARAAYIAAGGGARGPMKPLDSVSKG